MRIAVRVRLQSRLLAFYASAWSLLCLHGILLTARSAMHTEKSEEKPSPPAESPVDKSAEKKRAIRALKRVLIAKAEVRRIRALTHAKLAGSRR